jgi:nitroimidazol reductase NimA-like FMN-containing flavoprotein (pyridoxamine 5'-phosphate oxidase superfamily)
MPRQVMNGTEVGRLLEEAELVRVAFRDGESTYLIPLGCVCIEGVLYGVMEAGRKTELARNHPRVAFQTDTARTTGLFEWQSITGEGDFTIVTDPVEKAQVLDRLSTAVASAPAWWKAEQGPKMAAGELSIWRIHPQWMTGVKYEPAP